MFKNKLKMCGRFAQGDIDAIYSKYKIKVTKKLRNKFKVRYNLAPSQKATVVLRKNNSNVLEKMNWGLIPNWAKDKSLKLINARAQTIDKKPTFKSSFLNRRCIVPATGFYEWKKAQEEKNKQPYYIYPCEDKLFSVAGIYEINNNKKRFSILTTDSTDFLKPIHFRMPLLLDSSSLSAWLSEISNTKVLKNIINTAPKVKLCKHKVSKSVNSPAKDAKDITEPIK